MKEITVKDNVITVGKPSPFWIKGTTKSGRPIIIYFKENPFKVEKL